MPPRGQNLSEAKQLPVRVEDFGLTQDVADSPAPPTRAPRLILLTNRREAETVAHYQIRAP